MLTALLPVPRTQPPARDIVAALPTTRGHDRAWLHGVACRACILLALLVLAVPAMAQPELKPTPAGEAAIPEPAAVQTHPFLTAFNLAALLGGPIVLAGLWTANIIRPDSFRKRTAAPATDQPVPFLLIAAVLILLSQSIGGMLVANNLLPWPRIVTIHSTQGSAAVGLGAAIFGLAAAIALAGMTTKGWRTLLAYRDLGTGLLTLLLAYPLVVAASTLGTFATKVISHRTPDPIAHETLNQIASNPTDPWVMANMARAVIAAPIIEEIMYRLFLQGALIKVLHSPWLGILTTSALFAASHLQGGAVPWHALPALFVLSVGLGIVHVRTGRIGPPIVAHMAFNALNIALTLAR